MAVFNRSFTIREKMLILFLSLVLLGLIYYKFVDEPVRNGIEEANRRRDEKQSELDFATAELMQLQNMEKELEEGGTGSGSIILSRMPSYSYKKEEYNFLNQVLSRTLDYYIGFSGVQRDGELVRRNFSLRYDAESIEEAEEVIKELEDSEIRCLIGNISMSATRRTAENSSPNDLFSGPVAVNAVATFYETTFEGIVDRELPALPEGG